MTKCEFCHTSFTPRPQTKKARACEKRECQIKRQRLNEKEWKNRHKAEYGANFYREYRVGRFKVICELVERILKVLRIGCTALHENFSLRDFKEFLIPFLSRLGLGRANKLCPAHKALSNKELEGIAKGK
jgi:hypothetical protein